MHLVFCLATICYRFQSEKETFNLFSYFQMQEIYVLLVTFCRGLGQIRKSFHVFRFSYIIFFHVFRCRIFMVLLVTFWRGLDQTRKSSREFVIPISFW